MSTVPKRRRIQTHDGPPNLDSDITPNSSENDSTTQLSEFPSTSPTSDQNTPQVLQNPVSNDSNSTEPISTVPAGTRKRKKISIDQSSCSPENPQPSTSTPAITSTSSYEIVTDDIPILTDQDLDQYLDTTGVGKAMATKAYRRSKDASLIMFQDDNDQNEEEDEYINLTQLTPSEARIFLTKAHSQDKKEQLARSMERQEKAFLDSFSKKQSVSDQYFEEDLQKQELQRVLQETRKNILSKGKFYDPKTANFDYSLIQSPPVVFQPEMRGFGHILSQPASRGISFLASRKEFDLNKIKRSLNLQNVYISDDPSRITYQDPFEKLTTLYGQLKGDFNTLKSIDFTSRSVYELISCFSQVLITASRFSVPKLLKDLSDSIHTISIGTRRLMNVQTSLNYGLVHAKEIKSSSWHLATYVCAYLIKEGELSDLFRGLARMSEWKYTHYFNDSKLFSYDKCCHVASIAESVQCAEIYGEFPTKPIDNYDVLPPATADAWAARIRGLSRDYMKINRDLMMNGSEYQELHIDAFKGVIEQALRTLLQRSDGVILSYELLWNLFQDAANSEQINKFKEAEMFRKIVNEAKGKKPISKVSNIIAEAINQRIFYLIPLFAYAGQKTAKNFESITILMSEVDCLKIANSLGMIKDPNINVTAEDIKSLINPK